MTYTALFAALDEAHEVQTCPMRCGPSWSGC